LASEYVFTPEEINTLELVEELISLTSTYDQMYTEIHKRQSYLSSQNIHVGRSLEETKKQIYSGKVINPIINKYSISPQDLEYKILTSDDKDLGTLIQSIKDEFIKKLETI
jgi:hypothetical protein